MSVGLQTRWRFKKKKKKREKLREDESSWKGFPTILTGSSGVRQIDRKTGSEWQTCTAYELWRGNMTEMWQRPGARGGKRQPETEGCCTDGANTHPRTGYSCALNQIHIDTTQWEDNLSILQRLLCFSKLIFMKYTPPTYITRSNINTKKESKREI